MVCCYNKKTDNMQVVINGSNITVIVNDVSEKPADYDTGEWITVVNKKKLRREKKRAENEKLSKINELKKLRNKKIEERKNALLWYDSNSWQNKVLTNKYKFKDGTSVVEKYKLEELVQMYSEAKNNYRKNGVCGKMLKILTKLEWDNIKNDVEEMINDDNLVSE